MTPPLNRSPRVFLFCIAFISSIAALSPSLVAAIHQSPAIHDLNRSFSTRSNPTGAWRYGWKQTLDGELTLLTYTRRPVQGEASPTFMWQLNENESPAIGVASAPTNAASSAGLASGSPSAVLFKPGPNDAPENFAVARFTVPQKAAGSYRIECSIRHVDDNAQGDMEFHVVRGARQVFEHHLHVGQEIGFTNVLVLAEGMTVDFIVGRGRDRDRRNRTPSTMKMFARVLTVDLEPSVRPVVEQHPRDRSLPLGGVAVLAVEAGGTPPLAYQWLSNGREVAGQTNATLLITNLQRSDAGRYAARVSNRFGQTLSSNALLNVYGPSENLIANGSFELGVDPGLSSPFNSPDTNVIQDWTIDSGTIDYIGPRWAAFDGNRCVDLSGTTPGSIRQPIQGLAVGQSYRVRFHVAVNPESPPSSTAVQLSIAGMTNQFFATEVGTKSDLRWTEHTLQFTARETNTIIRFKSLNRGWSGPIIDAVSCLPVDAKRSQ